MTQACIECITKRQVKNRYGHPCKINSNQLRIPWTITAVNSTTGTALSCTVWRLGEADSVTKNGHEQKIYRQDTNRIFTARCYKTYTDAKT